MTPADPPAPDSPRGQANSCPDYLRKAEARLAEEAERVAACLPSEYGGGEGSIRQARAAAAAAAAAARPFPLPFLGAWGMGDGGWRMGDGGWRKSWRIRLQAGTICSGAGGPAARAGGRVEGGGGPGCSRRARPRSHPPPHSPHQLAPRAPSSSPALTAARPPSPRPRRRFAALLSLVLLSVSCPGCLLAVHTCGRCAANLRAEAAVERRRITFLSLSRPPSLPLIPSSWLWPLWRHRRWSTS